jgi:hypothetical protein
MSDFASAVSSLGCQWPPSINDHIFRSIDAAMNGQPRGQVQPADIDQYIHYSCRKQLQSMHNDLMQIIEQQIHLRNANIA